MDNELKQYAANFEEEVLAYENLPRDEFIKQYIDSQFDGDEDDETVAISEYFDCLEIQHYKNDSYNYFEITL